MRGAASTAALLLVCGALGGCGHEDSTTTGLRLQREDLVLVAHALRQAEGPVARELAAAKAVWAPIARGLPADPSAVAGPVRSAAAAARTLPLPALFSEQAAAQLTGPGFSIVGLYRGYQGLSLHGWQQIAAAIEQVQHGTPKAARFARENVALYIESVYDGHFGLAQIGKKLTDGFRKLEGPASFGGSLTGAEVAALAASYSEANDRLQPHVEAKLGS
jgi:hypothetical protein